MVEVREEAVAKVAEKEEILISRAQPAILRVAIEETTLHQRNKRKKLNIVTAKHKLL